MITNSKGVLQIPCTETKYAPSKQKKQNNKIYKAIGLTSSIWKKEGGDINITFGSYKYPNEPNVSPFAAWSYVGSQTNNALPGMNLGFIDPPTGSFEYDGKIYTPELYATRNYCSTNGTCEPGWTPGATVVHEFCHALGMLHEHQNNLNNMNTLKTSLNNDSVINYYRKLDPNDPDPVLTATSNVLDYYENKEVNETTYIGTNYDPNSIMHYALPNEWFNNYNSPGFKNPTNPIFVLSQDDINWLKQRYPIGDPSNYPIITIKFIDTFGSGAKDSFKDDIDIKHEDNCASGNNSQFCKEVNEIYNNITSKPDIIQQLWEKQYEWKKAWVQKIVLDTFVPLIGINFVFKNEKGIILRNVVSEYIYTQPAPTPTVSEAGGSEIQTSSDENVAPVVVSEFKNLEIVSGVLGAFISIGLIIGLTVLIYKSIGNRHSGIYFTFKNRCNL